MSASTQSNPHINDAPPVRVGLLGIVLRRWWVVALCAVVGAGAAALISNSQQKQYRATAKLLFGNESAPDVSVQGVFGIPSSATAPDPIRQAATNVALVGLDSVGALTARSLGHHLSASDVTSEIAVQGVGQTNVVSVTATDPSPTDAALLANTFARRFVDFRRNTYRSVVSAALQDVQRQFDALPQTARSAPSGQGQALRNRIDQLSALAALQTGNVELVQTAGVPSSPALPRTSLNIAAGALLSLILGIALVVLIQRLDRRIRDLDELKEAFGLPLLGVIPKSRALRARADGAVLPRQEAEAFQMLRTALRYAKADRDVRSVLVASASASEGKSTVAWNLAVAAASAGVSGTSQVLLIEADFHRPSIAAKYGLRPSPGLGDLILDELPLAKVIQSVPVSSDDAAGTGPVLDVIPAGDASSNPAGLLQSASAIEVLSMLTRLYGLVVIDTPPSALVADAIPLMRSVGAVVLVGRIGVTRRNAVRRLMEQLSHIEARIVGFVANEVTAGPRGSGYHADYGAYGAERNGQQLQREKEDRARARR